MTKTKDTEMITIPKEEWEALQKAKDTVTVPKAEVEAYYSKDVADSTSHSVDSKDCIKAWKEMFKGKKQRPFTCEKVSKEDVTTKKFEKAQRWIFFLSLIAVPPVFVFFPQPYGFHVFFVIVAFNIFTFLFIREREKNRTQEKGENISISNQEWEVLQKTSNTASVTGAEMERLKEEKKKRSLIANIWSGIAFAIFMGGGVAFQNGAPDSVVFTSIVIAFGIFAVLAVLGYIKMDNNWEPSGSRWTSARYHYFIGNIHHRRE